MIQYKPAKKIADRIVELFGPHCELIHIAGSIRRERQQVKDIEIVCRPAKAFVKTDLFGGGYWRVNEGFGAALGLIQDRVIKGNAEGRYMQMVLKGGAVLDLFMPQKEDYYRQLAIRTGSAEYSSFIIASAWKRKGWVGTHDGLRLQGDCQFNEKSSTWHCYNKKPELPPVWQSEEEFFAWLGVEWIHPGLREIKSSVNIYQ